MNKRTGLTRLVYALTYSVQGLRHAWHEPAFRQELLLLLVLLPAALWLGETWLERAALVGVWVFVMVVELLNTAIESAIDRIGTEHHLLSGRAKDIGSAAVLLALLLATGVWLAALWQRFSG